jgi:ABC-2 type transport system permease protein
VMMLLFGLAACGATLLSEKEGGTLRRLLASPAPPSSILYGKFLYSFVVGCAQLVVMFAFGRVVYGLPVEKHLVGTAAFIAATATAATGFGVLLAVVGRSRKQVEGLSTLIILVMSAIGGSWFPQFIMPEWMQTVAGFTLTGWAMKGFQGLYYFGKPLLELWPQLALLFGLGFSLLAVSTALFKRRFV